MERENIWVECMYNTNGASLVLTVGKQYLATIIDEHTYIMENDKGELDWFSKDRFKIVDKTPILNTIKWNGINSINRFVEEKRIEIEIQATQSHFTFILKVLIDKSFFASKQYVIQIDRETNKVEDFVKEINTICLKYNIKLELDQPKYKINCDKVYTKEEADKLKESGIDMMEVK
jgi:hypothetical protein